MAISELARKNQNAWLMTATSGLAVSAVVLTLFAALSNANSAAQGALAAIALSGACILSGGFLGFLFGIPRSQQSEANRAAVDGENRTYSDNTNLEQISDWLTKIIIGVTLVQFNDIRAIIADFAGQYAAAVTSISNPETAKAVVIAAIIYFSISGFLCFYLFTRLYMEGLLRRANATSVQEIRSIFTLQNREQGEKDSMALELVEEFLDVRVDSSSEKFAAIEDIVKDASLVAQTLIFEKAQKKRKLNWQQPEDRAVVARTVRVFRGLIAAKPDKYHRNYGQLGYALKDQPMPDWAGSVAALRKAIALRGDTPDSGTGYYEFNLAVGLIHIDSDFKQGRASGAASRADIAANLDSGKTVIDLKTEPAIVQWAALNGYAV